MAILTFDDLTYQLKHGIKARKFRNEIERVLQIIKQEQGNGLLTWEYQINQTKSVRQNLAKMLDSNDGKLGFSMFDHGLYASNYKPYSWIYSCGIDRESFTFSIDDLALMITFARNAKHRVESLKNIETIQKKASQFEFVAENREEYKLLVQNVEQAQQNMKEILNPVSRKLNDLRNAEECLDECIPLFLNTPIKHVQPLIHIPETQVESVKQLTEVIHNQHVSEKTKSEAKVLLEEIINSLKEEDKQMLYESAEMNAIAVIQASRQVHSSSLEKYMNGVKA